MNIQQQKKRFEKNWKTFSKKFGNTPWEEDPDFLYFIEIPVEGDTASEIKDISHSLQGLCGDRRDTLNFPKQFHITLALPGRKGVHFQGNDVKFMEKELANILKNFSSFEIELGDLNCFSNVVYREVHDPTGKLYQLHDEICKTIPFSQNPEYQFKNYIPHLSILYANKCGSGIITHSEFSRKLSQTSMKVEKIHFGKARSTNDKYQRKVLKEIIL